MKQKEIKTFKLFNVYRNTKTIGLNLSKKNENDEYVYHRGTIFKSFEGQQTLAFKEFCEMGLMNVDPEGMWVEITYVKKDIYNGTQNITITSIQQKHFEDNNINNKQYTEAKKIVKEEFKDKDDETANEEVNAQKELDMTFEGLNKINKNTPIPENEHILEVKDKDIPSNTNPVEDEVPWELDL